METIKLMNLGVRFFLEIIALVIFGFWGFRFSGSTLVKIILGVGTPILVATIWGTFGSPKAAFPLSGLSMLLLEIVIFGLSAAALYFTGKQMMAILYGLLVMINLVLLKIWNQ